MKKKNGFTLVELIVIIVIIGVIVLFALPNVISTIERQKKDAMITDAKDFKQKVDIYLTSTGGYPLNGCVNVSMTKAGIEQVDTPFGEKYDKNNSIVRVCLESSGSVSKYSYKIIIKSLKADGITRGYSLDDTHGDLIDISVLNAKEKYKYIHK